MSTPVWSEDTERRFREPTPFQAACDHHESLWGRCVFCGRTWEQQAEDRAMAAES